jgi:hypothetical protein
MRQMPVLGKGKIQQGVTSSRRKGCRGFYWPMPSSTSCRKRTAAGKRRSISRKGRCRTARVQLLLGLAFYIEQRLVRGVSKMPLNKSVATQSRSALVALGRGWAFIIEKSSLLDLFLLKTGRIEMAKKKATKSPDPQDSLELKAGVAVRFECDDCMTEFEVCLEPKARGLPDAQAQIEPKEIELCPFCGSIWILVC